MAVLVNDTGQKLYCFKCWVRKFSGQKFSTMLVVLCSCHMMIS